MAFLFLLHRPMKPFQAVIFIAAITLAKFALFVFAPAWSHLLVRHPLYSTATEGFRESLETGPLTPLHAVAAIPAHHGPSMMFASSILLQGATAYVLFHAAGVTAHQGTVLALYLLNPVMVAEAFSLSLSPLLHLIVSCLLAAASRRVFLPCALLTSLVVTWNILTVGLYSVVLLVCTKPSHILVTAAILIVQMGLSSTWAFGITYPPDVTPNFGLYWYLHQLMFSSFRVLYTYLFASMPLVYVVPLVAKLAPQTPAGRLRVLMSVIYAIAVYHSQSPSLPCLFFSYHIMHASDPLACNTMKYLFPFLGLLSASTVVGHVYLHSWLVLRRTNANFFYFATLAFASAFLLFLTQFLTRVILAQRERVR